jgi:hypothetical protein
VCRLLLQFEQQTEYMIIYILYTVPDTSNVAARAFAQLLLTFTAESMCSEGIVSSKYGNLKNASTYLTPTINPFPTVNCSSKQIKVESFLFSTHINLINRNIKMMIPCFILTLTGITEEKVYRYRYSVNRGTSNTLHMMNRKQNAHTLT